MRESDREAADILERRHEEEERIAKAMRDSEQRPPGTFHAYTPKHLLVSNYDTTRAKISVDDRVEGGDDKKTTRDYLTPFLPSYARRDGHALSRVDAIKVRDDCLEAFKERLVERANIVQARLDEENAAFSKRQAAFQRNRDNLEQADEVEYESYCKEALFRIQILEQRLNRHSELSLQKFSDLDVRLRTDARMVNLTQAAAAHPAHHLSS